MSRSTGLSSSGPLAYTGGNAYAYTGGNAYAYAGGNAYAHGASMEAYGFDGYPGNPMLGAALQGTRAAIRRDILTGPLGSADDIGGARDWGDAQLRLPPADDTANVRHCGAQVRLSMALMELTSSVEFHYSPDQRCAMLRGRGRSAQNALVLADLVWMKRPSRSYLDLQLGLVDRWGPARDSRMAEVLTQVAPPLAFFASVMNLQSARHRKTLEFVNLSVQFAYAVCMRFKLALNVPRPSELSAALMPVLETPPHRALPAGHANEAHVTALVLSQLARLPANSAVRQALRRLAHRIGENRVVAGLHFPVDNVAGRLLGDVLASYVLASCGACPEWQGRVRRHRGRPLAQRCCRG
ncbi:MAG: phosphatase PAP2 family protein [Rubrivivax sp.]|nr:phosphatase PAP2 family protein [Rubrivivax sp.]